MKKLVILIFAFVLVFGLFVQIGFCDGDNDECTPSCPDTCPGHSCPGNCNCDDTCSSGTLTSTSKITYYYAYGQQKSYNFGTKQYYSSPPTFTDEDYYTYSCYPDGCGSYCCTCCGCDSSTISCKGWQKCYDDDSFGCPDDSTGCKCEDEYCKGWCMDNAPVYDGLAACSAASDGDWVATTAFSSKPAKYKLNTDYHSANMNGGCYCNYYEIKNFYECDSAKINDSHPCSSNNCAPDFAGGRNYCCEFGYCSHRGNDAICLNCGGIGKKDKTGSGTQSDVHCYESGAIVQYQGYKFKCNNGNWEFIGGEKNDFSDNCGKTIFNYPLFFNIKNFYPNGYGYKNSYAIYPVSFKGIKDIVVSVIPNNIVKINGDDTRYKVFKKKTGRFDIKFKGNEKGNPFNLTINCYTPDEKPCSPEHDDCWPSSYCSQDSPTNIIEYKTLDKADFYCCPNNSCAHKGRCYPEGSYYLSIPGESSESPCLWNCKNNVWGKQLEGAKCKKNCDCNLPNETNYHCVQTIYNLSKKICCPIGYCGLNAESGKCVPKGKLAGTGKYSKCICNGDSWDCVNTEIETDYSRILFSENSKEYEISLEIKKTKLKDITSANATVIVFFDNRSYSGNIKITGYDDCFFISTTKPIKEKFEFSKNFASITDGFKCKLKIEAPDLKENEYFFYTSSALILEYI